MGRTIVQKSVHRVVVEWFSSLGEERKEIVTDMVIKRDRYGDKERETERERVRERKTDREKDR